jgi:hypothetical protein
LFSAPLAGTQKCPELRKVLDFARFDPSESPKVESEDRRRHNPPRRPRCVNANRFRPQRTERGNRARPRSDPCDHSPSDNATTHVRWTTFFRDSQIFFKVTILQRLPTFRGVTPSRRPGGGKCGQQRCSRASRAHRGDAPAKDAGAACPGVPQPPPRWPVGSWRGRELMVPRDLPQPVERAKGSGGSSVSVRHKSACDKRSRASRCNKQ